LRPGATSDEEQVVVSGLQQEEALRACGRLEEGPPLLDGDDVVPHAVADEDGAVQRPYTPEARVGVGPSGVGTNGWWVRAIARTLVNVESRTRPQGGASSVRAIATAPPSDSPT
jgi:hypothetical protein